MQEQNQRTSPWLIAWRVIFTFALIGCIVFIFSNSLQIADVSEGASGRVISRSVAQDTSQQIFYPRMIGDAAGFGHVQCDSILMGQAKIQSIPALTANHPDAQLIHEAAIGRIAGDQILKLMTLGLTEEEAEEEILNGFLG